LIPTQLREFYDILGALKEEEQTALAEFHAADPERLILRFEKSVRTVAKYEGLDPAEAFHPNRALRTRTDATDDEPIGSTADFAGYLETSITYRVSGADGLDFRYLDREISTLNSKMLPVEARVARRSVDLLLSDSEGRLPIVGELKRKKDSPTYFALIQSLMYAVDLNSAVQRRRLDRYGLSAPETGPFVGIYLIGYKASYAGDNRKRSFQASKTIAAKLMRDARVTSVVNRIAYLDATLGADGLAFESVFSFPSNR
jgi:hypothetical protein